MGSSSRRRVRLMHLFTPRPSFSPCVIQISAWLAQRPGPAVTPSKLDIIVRTRAGPCPVHDPDLSGAVDIYSNWGVPSSTTSDCAGESVNAMESTKRPGSGEAEFPWAESTVASSTMSLPLVKPRRSAAIRPGHDPLGGWGAGRW